MTLTRTQYEETVARYEQYARRKPLLYQAFLVILVAVGYLAIPVALLLSLLILILSGFSLMLRTAYFLLWALHIFIQRLKATWHAFHTQWERPTGYELKSADAPALFAILNEVTARLHAPRVHHVLLTREFNASMSQMPRLGVLGFQCNTLLIGFPMLLALSPAELQAIIAHELAHLSGQHARFGVWISRVQVAWHNFMEALSGDKVSRFGLNWFFKRLIPLFEPHAFVLSRLHELEADRRAAELFGANITAAALLQTELQAKTLQQFGEAFKAATEEDANPPEDFYLRMQAALKMPMPREAYEAALSEACNEPTDFLDPHPGMHDRLVAVGCQFQRVNEQWMLPVDFPLPSPPQTSAAEAWLGENLPGVLAHFNQTWWFGNLYHWVERYRTRQEDQRQLEDEEAADTERTIEQAWDYAQRMLRTAGEEEALPLLRALLDREPEHVPACGLLGRLLLDKKDDAGIPYIRTVMERDHQQALEACGHLYNYMVSTGRPAEADKYEVWARQYIEMRQKAGQERMQINRTNVYLQHDWPEHEVAKLRKQLARIPGVAKAYLVRKQVTQLPEIPCYLLGVVRSLHNSWFTVSSDSDQRVAKQLVEMVHSGRELIFYVESFDTSPLPKMWGAVENSVVYQREKGKR